MRLGQTEDVVHNVTQLCVAAMEHIRLETGSNRRRGPQCHSALCRNTTGIRLGQTEDVVHNVTQLCVAAMEHNRLETGSNRRRGPQCHSALCSCNGTQQA